MIRWMQKQARTHNVAPEQLVTASKPTSATAEAYRTLRTNLLYDALVDHPSKVIVLTSPGNQEDKSTVCANLGVALAQSGRRTLIVDCDLSNPVLHKTFGLRSSHGIADALNGKRSLEEVWQEPLSDLKIITGVHSPFDATNLLGSERFARFLSQVRLDFDHVLIDAPPIQSVPDAAAILAAQGDGVLLILDYAKTRKRNVRQAMRSLEAVRANVLGTVLTNVKVPRDTSRR